MKRRIRIWLVEKEMLVKSPNEHTAIAEPFGTLDLDQIVDQMLRQNPGYKRELIMSVIQQYQHIITQLLAEGYKLNTGLTHMKPVVKGKIKKRKWDDKSNSIQISITPANQIRKAMEGIKGKIMGNLREPTVISAVSNLKTKKYDNTITQNFPFFVTGRRIKITGEVPEVGVYLINSETKEEFKFDPVDYIDNNPKSLMLYLPDTIPVGSYTLKIVTQYSSNRHSVKIHETIYNRQINVVSNINNSGDAYTNGKETNNITPECNHLSNVDNNIIQLG